MDKRKILEAIRRHVYWDAERGCIEGEDEAAHSVFVMLNEQEVRHNRSGVTQEQVEDFINQNVWCSTCGPKEDVVGAEKAAEQIMSLLPPAKKQAQGEGGENA